MAAHRYWRIRTLTQNGGGFSSNLLVLLTEVEMRVSIGGADQCTGGTAIGQNGFATGSGEDPASAFDNNTATWWQGWVNNTADNTRPRPCFIGYDFGAGNEKDIIEVGIAAHATYLDRTPRTFVVESSDDNVAWAFEWLSTPKTWPNNTMRSFAKPTAQASNRYWMLYSRRHEREAWNGNLSVAELKFYEAGVDVTSGGSGIGDVNFSGTTTPAKAFDADTNSYYASLYTDEAWIGYDFGSGVNRDINRVDFRARADFDGQAVQAGQLFYSQDGVSWLPDWGFVTLPQWATGEIRTFNEGDVSGKYGWRIRFITRQGGSGAVVLPYGLGEIQFRAVAGVAVTDTNLIVGVARASSVYTDSGSYAPGRAFDGVTTGDLEGVTEDQRGGSVAGAEWIGMFFNVGREVAEVMLRARNNFPADSPSEFVIEYTEDHGISWIETDTYSGLTWIGGEEKTFAVSGTTPVIGRRRQMPILT